ncbi:MAG TPA: hypothetical protein DCZ94_20770 [Lentisphaeria bacterium]|nr:MAG: hypothetical protein A2X48_09080 [Lentisphaerae bacterium GWF2_49_21]HBC89381.1 hypothetical protein [Lentisphaeria bacterium]
MPFLKPYFLIALAVVLVPLIIHLLTRDQIKKVAFSTIRFFVGTSKNILRKKKIREAFLLASRMLACALIALAFARPMFSKDKPAQGGRFNAEKARAIVVDASASMAGTDKSIRKQSEDALSDLSEGSDAAVLIGFSGKPSVVGPSKDFAGIRDAISRLAPGNGGTDIAEALRTANSMLSGVEASDKSIILISDLQRSGWQSFKGGWKLAPGIKMSIIKVAPALRSDRIAITEGDYPHNIVLDKIPRVVAAKVANFSDNPRSAVEVSLSVNGKVVETEKINIPARQAVAVRFRTAFANTGDNLGIIRLTQEDAKQLGSAYYFNTRVNPTITITLISQPGDNTAKFIAIALQPPGADSPFRIRMLNSQSLTPKDINESGIVILNNVDSAGAEICSALNVLLQRGGGIIYLPGDKVGAERFNNAFAAISPAKLSRIMTAPATDEQEQGLSLTKVNGEHPIFEIFQKPHHGDLSGPRFSKFWELTDSQLSKVSARFSNDRPAVLERQIGQGIAIMMTSSISGDWSNLVIDKGPMFVSIMHQIARYIAMKSERKSDYFVGDELKLSANEKISDPEGGKITDRPVIATQPGFYVVETGTEKFSCSVNVMPGEADPTEMKQEEITMAVVPVQGENLDAAGDEVLAKEAKERIDKMALWRYLILALAVLLAGELFLGNKTVRH